MRRELLDLVGSGLLFAAFVAATIAALAPSMGAGAAPSELPAGPAELAAEPA